MKRPTLVALATVAAAAAVPASASAASIALTVPGGTPTIAYTAAPNEVNALEMHGTVNGGLDLRMPFSEYSAPLTLGASCSGLLPTICGSATQSYPVTVSLADKDDVANVNSFTNTLTMDAGSGNDDVLAGGINASADGGSGNDSILVAANSLATANGGDGRDRIYGGLGAAAATLTGGGNGDLLVPDGFAFDDAKGGSGDDRLVSLSGDTVTLSGEGGNDILTAPTGRGDLTLNGGSGIDTIVSHVGGVTVDAGSGTDIVDVRGDASSAPDTLSCGSGFDLAWANSTDDVAGDCEIVITHGAPPVLSRVTSAIDAAHALIAHRPNPAGI
jgi:Ca2+-binding RTX toxin-like protein